MAIPSITTNIQQGGLNAIAPPNVLLGTAFIFSIPFSATATEDSIEPFSFNNLASFQEALTDKNAVAPVNGVNDADVQHAIDTITDFFALLGDGIQCYGLFVNSTALVSSAGNRDVNPGTFATVFSTATDSPASQLIAMGLGNIYSLVVSMADYTWASNMSTIVPAGTNDDFSGNIISGLTNMATFANSHEATGTSFMTYVAGNRLKGEIPTIVGRASPKNDNLRRISVYIGATKEYPTGNSSNPMRANRAAIGQFVGNV